MADSKFFLTVFAVVLLILGVAMLTREPAMIALSQQTDLSDAEYQVRMNALWHQLHHRQE